MYMDWDTASGYSADAVKWYGVRDQIRSVEMVDRISPVSVAYWFNGCSQLSSANVAKLDMSNITDTRYMFNGATLLSGLSSSAGWNMSSLSNASHMFSGCANIWDIDFAENWDMSSLTDASEMFSGCTSLANIAGAANWNTSAVKNFSGMFRNDSTLDDIRGARSWDTSEATNMSSMFNGCYSLSDARPINQWSTAKVADMNGLFDNCTSLEIADVANWDMSGVASNSSKWVSFRNDANLARLVAGSGTKISTAFPTHPYDDKWRQKDGDADDITSAQLIARINAGNGCGIWVWDFRPIAVFDSDGNTLTFYGEDAIKSFEASSTQTVYKDWDAVSYSSAADVPWSEHMPYIESVIVADYGISPISTAYWFDGCTNLAHADLTKLDTSDATSMKAMFRNTSMLGAIDISSFDCSKVSDASGMFDGASAMSITLGEGYKFAGAVFATPPADDPYTGKWLNLAADGAVPVDSADLAANYDGSTQGSYGPGTYAWAKVRSYIVRFDANGGAGSMPQELVSVDEDHALPASAFTYYKHAQTSWQDADEQVYELDATIASGTMEDGGVLVLSAVWEDADDSYHVSGNTIEVKLKAGERVTLKDVPAGTAYAIYEETPAGWIVASQSDAVGTVGSLQHPTAAFTNRYAPGETSATVYAIKTLDGLPSGTAGYTFQLREEGQPGIAAPEVVTSDGGLVMFAPLTFDSAGYHSYTISEVPGDDPDIIYDSHIEELEINVVDDGHGNLSAAVSYDGDGARFDNRVKPGSLAVEQLTEGLNEKNAGSRFSYAVRLFDEKGDSLPYAMLSIVDGQGSGVPGRIEPDAEGIFSMTLASGEKAVFSDIPAGTNYEVSRAGVYLGTRSVSPLPSHGWSAKSSSGESGTIAVNMRSDSEFTNRYAASGDAVVSVYKHMDGRVLRESEFSFELLDSDGDPLGLPVANGAPIADPADEAEEAHVGEGVAIFPALQFDAAGTYSYKVREVEGVADDVVYDSSVRDIRVEMIEISFRFSE